jgi:hypothetical protein
MLGVRQGNGGRPLECGRPAIAPCLEGFGSVQPNPIVF